MVLLFFLLSVAIGMIVSMFNNVTPSFSQTIITFYGDTLRNKKLSDIIIEKKIYRENDYAYKQNHLRITQRFAGSDAEASRRPHHISSNLESHGLVSMINIKSSESEPIVEDSSMHRGFNTNVLINKRRVNDHEQFIYFASNDSSYESRPFSYEIMGRDVFHKNKNPQASFWLGVNIRTECELSDSSMIKILMNKKDVNKSVSGIFNPLSIDQIVPEPSIYNISEIIYRGKDKIHEVIKNGGVFIQVTDPTLKSESEKMQIINTVLAGTLLAFCLDIIVHLVKKWRRLEDSYVIEDE